MPSGEGECFSCCQNKWRCYCCCMSWTRCKLVTKGIFARVIFIVYILACLTFAIFANVDHISLYWDADGNDDKIFQEFGQYVLLAILFSFLALQGILIESCVTLCCKRHGEWKRFCPIMFIFLFGSVPILYMLETAKISGRQIGLNKCYENSNNSKICLDEHCDNSQLKPDWFEPVLLGFEQTLVVLLVLGRWFLPRGTMTREQLSDMLFAFVGMAVDILDFLQTGLGLNAMKCHKGRSLVVWILTTFSLLQFTFDLHLFIGFENTKKSEQKPTNNSLWDGLKTSKISRALHNPEVRTILMNMFLQDAPFFVFRMYVLVNFFVTPEESQSLTFFITKNVLVLALQGYRLWIILRRVSISRKQLVPICI